MSGTLELSRMALALNEGEDVIALRGTNLPTNLFDFYKSMLLIRRFEERAGQLYGMELFAGFCHLYIGQEAIAVGMRSFCTVALTRAEVCDLVTPTPSCRARRDVKSM